MVPLRCFWRHRSLHRRSKLSGTGRQQAESSTKPPMLNQAQVNEGTASVPFLSAAGRMGVGLVSPPGTASHDLLLPLYMGDTSQQWDDDRVSVVQWQVKNTSRITNTPQVTNTPQGVTAATHGGFTDSAAQEGRLSKKRRENTSGKLTAPRLNLKNGGSAPARLPQFFWWIEVCGFERERRLVQVQRFGSASDIVGTSYGPLNAENHPILQRDQAFGAALADLIRSAVIIQQPEEDLPIARELDAWSSTNFTLSFLTFASRLCLLANGTTPPLQQCQLNGTTWISRARFLLQLLHCRMTTRVPRPFQSLQDALVLNSGFSRPPRRSSELPRQDRGEGGAL